MKNNSLYTLTNEFLEIVGQLEEVELDQETLKDTLDSLQAPIEEKVENTIKYMKNLEALADAKKLEAKRLSDAASSDLKKVESLKNYLDNNLKRTGIRELQAGIFNVKYKKGSEVVKIDESQLPEQYFTPQPPKPISKTDLKKLVKEGQEIPGVWLVRNEDSLVIK